MVQLNQWEREVKIQIQMQSNANVMHASEVRASSPINVSLTMHFNENCCICRWWNAVCSLTTIAAHMNTTHYRNI